MREPTKCQGFGGTCGADVISLYCPECGRPRSGYPKLRVSTFTATDEGEKMLSLKPAEALHGTRGQSYMCHIFDVPEAEQLIADLQAAVAEIKGPVRS